VGIVSKLAVKAATAEVEKAAEKAVELIRKGMSPTAALLALGYSASALAEER
jgi:hypothetical protein